MPAIETEFAIVGGGQCGVPLTRTLSEAGRRVVLFEREHLGGSCVNFGCTPSKAAISSARLAHQVRRAGEFGLDMGPLKVEFVAITNSDTDLATFRKGVHIHPTLAEGVHQAVAEICAD